MGDIWKMLIDERTQWVQPTRESPYGRETAFWFLIVLFPPSKSFDSALHRQPECIIRKAPILASLY
jgi:hypothetical protein